MHNYSSFINLKTNIKNFSHVQLEINMNIVSNRNSNKTINAK